MVLPRPEAIRRLVEIGLKTGQTIYKLGNCCARASPAVGSVRGDTTMPLVVEGKSKAVAHSELRAIGFWMSVKGANPIQPVRVFVTYEALAKLDPTNVRDFTAAFEHFDRFRTRIEAAASGKFDPVGPDAEKFGGMPTVRITTNDPV
jgi:hypothetical protein